MCSAGTARTPAANSRQVIGNGGTTDHERALPKQTTDKRHRLVAIGLSGTHKPHRGTGFREEVAETIAKADGERKGPNRLMKSTARKGSTNALCKE